MTRESQAALCPLIYARYSIRFRWGSHSHPPSCVYIHMCSCVCTCRYMCVHGTRKPEVIFWSCALGSAHRDFLKQGFQLARSSDHTRLTARQPRFPPVCEPAALSSCPCPLPSSQVCTLARQAPTDCAMLPAPQSPATGLHDITSGSWKTSWENLTFGKLRKQAPGGTPKVAFLLFP